MKAYGFLNPRAGVGKTTLTFNLGWLLAEAGFRVLLADLDPQGELTVLAGASGVGPTIHDALAPVVTGGDAIATVPPHRINERLHLLRGDMALAYTEDFFARAWPASPGSGCIRELLLASARELEADVVLCDLGSSLGASTRAAAWAVDGLVVPLPSKETIDGAVELQRISAMLAAWRASSGRNDAFALLGYVLTWSSHRPPPPIEGHRLLGVARAYPSLYSMARASHRPVVALSPSDGALGSLQYAVQDALGEYDAFASHLAGAGGLFDDVGLPRLVAEAIEEARAELGYLFEPRAVPSIVSLDEARISNGHLRARGSGLLAVERAMSPGGDEGRPHALPFVFDLELARDRSLAQVHELRIDRPEPPAD